MAGPDVLSFYAILGVAKDASLDVLKARFREAARQVHPDRSDRGNGSAAGGVPGDEAFIAVRRAFEVLSDPAARRKYDAELAAAEMKDGHVHDTIDLDDMTYVEEMDAYEGPCRCGDLLRVTTSQLELGEDLMECPSCSLQVQVLYEEEEEESADATEENQKSEARKDAPGNQEGAAGVPCGTG
eukprot:g1911.t1